MSDKRKRERRRNSRAPCRRFAAGSRPPLGTLDLLDRSQEQAAAGGRERGLRRERAADLCDGGAAERRGQRGRRNLGLRRRGVRMKDWTDWIDREMSRVRGAGMNEPFLITLLVLFCNFNSMGIYLFQKWVYTFAIVVSGAKERA